MENQHLKVLMFGWELPPHNSGGLGVACYGLAKGLVKQGVDISFGLPRPIPGTTPFMDLLDTSFAGFNVTAINSFLYAYHTSRQYSQFRQHMSDTYKMEYGPTIYEEAQRFASLGGEWAKSVDHQLIHVHDWMTYPAGQVAARVSGRPMVAHVHATEFDRTGGDVDQRIAEIEYNGLSKADRVIAVSQYTKNVIHDKYCVPNDRISVVHNGIDAIEFSQQDIRRIFPNDKVVLFVGRLTFQKGVDYFLHSARMVLDQHPNTVFIIAGSGDMEQHLLMQSAYLGIGHRVIFAGFMQGAKLNSLYQMADVFVMPSVSEPFGIVALEAVARGIPTIVSKQSGVAESLTTVHTVDYWDTHLLAQEILNVLRYPSVAQEWAGLAKLQAKAQTWEAAAIKTQRIYQQLLA